MKTFLYPVLALPLIVGCTSLPFSNNNEMPFPVADRPAAAPVDVGIDWGWRLVGDQAVRPVQVFSSNDKTYVQMRDNRAVVLLVGGEIVPFLTSWPYLVVQGVPDRIDIVFDGYRAVAEHVSARNQTDAQAPVPTQNQASPQAYSRLALPNPVKETRRVERVRFK